jgi:hypothetical protein
MIFLICFSFSFESDTNFVVGKQQTICSQCRYILTTEKVGEDNVKSQIVSAIRPNVINKRRNIGGCCHFEDVFLKPPEQPNLPTTTVQQPSTKKLKGKSKTEMISSSQVSVSDSSGKLSITISNPPDETPRVQPQAKFQNLYWIGSINEEENKKLFDHLSHNNPCGFFVVCARPLFSAANSSFCMTFLILLFLVIISNFNLLSYSPFMSIDHL